MKRMSKSRFGMFGNGHVQDNHTHELWEWLKAERAALEEAEADRDWLADVLWGLDIDEPSVGSCCPEAWLEAASRAREGGER